MKIRSESFKGKRIQFADTDRVGAMREIADEFMFAIFELEAGGYLITDESSLTDFCDFHTANNPALWKLVEDSFGISATGAGANATPAPFRA